jgi:hypothetical protein
MAEDSLARKRKAEDELSPEQDFNLEESNRRPKLLEDDSKDGGMENDEMRIDEAVATEDKVDLTGKPGTETRKKTVSIGGSGQAETEDDRSAKREEQTAKGRRENSSQNPYEKLCWTIIKNDGRPESLIKLVALKSLFSKQLPKMPKAYIARLVFERRHISLVILSDDPKVKDTDKEVIGSICYRPFLEMRFAEIAFCAVNSDHQVKVNFL